MATRGAAFALGFGERGGLAVWENGARIQARGMTADAAPRGRVVDLPLPPGAEPRQVVPVPGGFAVIALRPSYHSFGCTGTYTTGDCDAGPGVPIPEACERLSHETCRELDGYDVFAQPSDPEGRALGEARSFRMGPSRIVAVLPGRGRTLGFATGDELVTLHVRPGGPVEEVRVELPRAKFMLPVRGTGPPSILLFDEYGAPRLVDAGGVHSLGGSVSDARTGFIRDARLQARWGPDGRIHVARQAWLISVATIWYGVVEDGALQADGEPVPEFRAPFGDYVVTRPVGQRFRRGTWLQKTVGEDIDLHAVDPHADGERARVSWNGKAFVFGYTVERPNGWTLLVTAADCSQG
jgi:hypothetical protein